MSENVINGLRTISKTLLCISHVIPFLVLFDFRSICYKQCYPQTY